MTKLKNTNTSVDIPYFCNMIFINYNAHNYNLKKNNAIKLLANNTTSCYRDKPYKVKILQLYNSFLTNMNMINTEIQMTFN